MVLVCRVPIPVPIHNSIIDPIIKLTRCAIDLYIFTILHV